MKTLRSENIPDFSCITMAVGLLLALSLLSLLRTVPASLTFILVTGQATPSEFPEVLDQAQSWFPSRPSVRFIRSHSFDLEAFTTLLRSANAVIDATYSSFEVQMIAEMCGQSAVPHLVLGYVSEAVVYPWTFYLSGRYQDLADSLDAVVSYFGWSRVNVLTDSSLFSRRISTLLAAKVERRYQETNFALQNQSTVERIVGRNMRAKGNRISIFLTTPELTESIIRAQWAMGIGGLGFENVMLLSSSFYPDDISNAVPSLSTGTMILAPEELLSVSSLTAYYTLQLNTAAALFINYTDSDSMCRSLELRYPSHTRKPSFSLLNMQTGLRVTVGQVVAGNCSITDTIYFLGNTTDVPRNGNSQLQISGDFGVRNVNSYYMSALLYYYGAVLAVEQINARSDLLDNFNIDLFNFTAGVQIWDYNFAYNNVYPVRDKLGLAVFSSTSSSVTLKLIPFLLSLNYSGPIIGSSNTVNALSSTANFPTYVRTLLPDSNVVRVYVQMFRVLGWLKCALFVSNETWGLGIRSVFTDLASASGIEIMNDPSLQILPTPIPSVDTLRNYTKNFQDFIDTKARVLVIAVNNNAVYVIDYLYELGLRAGDLQVVANEFLTMGFIYTNDTVLYRKRSELLRGAVQYFPVSYVGAFGKGVKQDYVNSYDTQPPEYACFYYDSVLAVATALDTMILLGQDYTNPSLLLETLRSSRFTGCSGPVTYSLDSNDRSPMPYNIFNAQFGENDTLITDIVPVGEYNPTSINIFEFDSPIIWCSGTTVIPEDIRRSSIGCPFEDKFNLDFPKGRYVLYGVCTGLALLTSLLLTVQWKLCGQKPLEHLTERKEFLVLDAMITTGIAVELLQYISLGPNLNFITAIGMQAAESSTLSLEDMVSLKNGGFGLLLLGVFIAVGFWTIMCIMVFFGLGNKLKRFSACRLLIIISEFSVPLFGNWLFVPIVSTFADVFVCVKGVGVSTVSFADSYLSLDCFLNCWSGTHLLYVIGAGIGLFLYLPAAVLMRPLWQEMQDQLNIKMSVHFLVAKTTVQVGLIIIEKTLKSDYPLVHCVVFIATFLLFLGFCAKFQCFGYRRTALWHILSLIAVLWVAFWALVQMFSTALPDSVLLGIAFSGWAVFFLFGIVYQTLKIPSLLYRKPGVDVSNLFQFAFKKSTPYTVSALRESFQKARHGSAIRVANQLVQTERPYTITTEGRSDDREAVSTPRLNRAGDDSLFEKPKTARRENNREGTLESFQIE